MEKQILKSEESNLIKRLKDLEYGSTVLISSDNKEKRKEQFLEDIKKITVNVLKNHFGNYYSIFLKEHKFIKVYFKSHLYDTDFSHIQGIPKIDFWYRYNAGKISKSFEDMAKCRFSNEDNRYILNFKKEKNKKIIKEDKEEMVEQIEKESEVNIFLAENLKEAKKFIKEQKEKNKITKRKSKYVIIDFFKAIN